MFFAIFQAFWSFFFLCSRLFVSLQEFSAFLCIKAVWGIERKFACIFEAGPKEIYHIVNDQETVMIPLADIDDDGWVLLVMSLDVKLELSHILRLLTGVNGSRYVCIALTEHR